MAITDIVTSAVNTSVARVARAARHALERIAPSAEGGEEGAPAAAPPQRAARKSKGWRKHLRAQKARQKGSRG